MDLLANALSGRLDRCEEPAGKGAGECSKARVGEDYGYRGQSSHTTAVVFSSGNSRPGNSEIFYLAKVIMTSVGFVIVYRGNILIACFEMLRYSNRT